MRTLDDVAETLLRLAQDALTPSEIKIARTNIDAGYAIEAVEDLLHTYVTGRIAVPPDVLDDAARTAPAEWRPPQDRIITEAIAILRTRTAA